MAPVGSRMAAVGAACLRQVLVLLSGRDVALLAGRGGEDREPDDAFGGPLFLEGFHVAAVVVLLVVGAAAVGPLEDDPLAAVLREGLGFAVGVGAFEVGGLVAGFDGEGGGGDEAGGEDGGAKCVGHAGHGCFSFVGETGVSVKTSGAKAPFYFGASTGTAEAVPLHERTRALEETPSVGPDWPP